MSTSERRKNFTPEQREAERLYRIRYQSENRELLAKKAAERRAAGKCKGTSYYRARMTPEERDKARAKRRDAYQRNQKKEIEAARAYRAANPDVVKNTWRKSNSVRKEKLRAYYQENKDRIRERQRKWREANHTRVAARQAAYLQKNLHKHRANQNNRRARKLANGGRLSADIVQKLLTLQRGLCACCKKPLGDSFDLDHIVPLALGGPNSDENMQLLLARCNRQKAARHPVEFMQSRGLLL